VAHSGHDGLQAPCPLSGQEQTSGASASHLIVAPAAERREAALKKLCCLAIVVGLSVSLGPAAFAQFDKPSSGTPSALDELVHYARDHKDCAAWTDSCVNCSRTDPGSYSCSNIGIACQPKEVVCVRRRNQ
jgi:hypothetical protein